MCEECLQSPCDNRCPNADPGKPECYCDDCREGIYEDECFYKMPNGETICEACIDRMYKADLLEYFGCKLVTA